MPLPTNVTIPPLLPHQVRKPDGSGLDGSTTALTFTATKDGVDPKLFHFAVTAPAGAVGKPTQWDFGDTGAPYSTGGSTADHGYLVAGSYTVWASQTTGSRQGSVSAAPTLAAASRKGKATVEVKE